MGQSKRDKAVMVRVDDVSTQELDAWVERDLRVYLKCGSGCCPFQSVLGLSSTTTRSSPGAPSRRTLAPDSLHLPAAAVLTGSPSL